MKKCRFCAEQIQDEAIVCRFCGRDLNVVKQAQSTVAQPNVSQPTVATVTAPRPSAPIGIQKIDPKVGLIVTATGFALTLVPNMWGIDMWGIGFLGLWLGLMLLGWRRTFPTAKLWLLAVICFIVASVLQFPGGWLKDRRRQQQEQAQAAALRAQNEARVRDWFRMMQEHMAAGRWREAAGVNASITASFQQEVDRIMRDTALTPDQRIAAAKKVREEFTNAVYPGRSEAEKTINEHIRTLDIQQGITDAQLIASDPKKCDQATAIAGAWNKVKQVRSTDPQWAKALAAAAQLESCRIQVERELSSGMQKIMVAQREAWSQKADTTFLEKGMNVTISLSGANKDHVTLKWALMSRAAAYKVTNGGSMAPGSFLDGLQKIGFKRVTFPDGFNNSWFYELNPQDETNSGGKVLRMSGIGEPLVLTR